MAGFTRSFVFRPEDDELLESKQDQGPPKGLDELFGEVQPMDFTWAEGSSIFHTRARCSRYRAIEGKNRRSQRSEPRNMSLCDICRAISLRGRKG